MSEPTQDHSEQLDAAKVMDALAADFAMETATLRRDRAVDRATIDVLRTKVAALTQERDGLLDAARTSRVGEKEEPK